MHTLKVGFNSISCSDVKVACNTSGALFVNDEFLRQHEQAMHPHVASSSTASLKQKKTSEEDDVDAILAELLVDEDEVPAQKAKPSTSAPVGQPKQPSKSAHPCLVDEHVGLCMKRCKHGYFMYNPLDNTHGRALDVYGQYSEGEVEVFRQLVRMGDIVVDAGANVGMFTVPLADMVGLSGEVL